MAKLDEFPDGMYVEVRMWWDPTKEEPDLALDVSWEWVTMRVVNSYISPDDLANPRWVKVEYEHEDPRKKFWVPASQVRKAEFPTVVNGQWSGCGSS